MHTRDELKALIDQMPPEKLDLFQMNLESILNPPVIAPQIERTMRRAEELQRELVERLPQLQAGCKPETIRGFDGGGGIGCGPGQRNQGGYTYSWFEGITHVTHRLMIHAGREIDIVERLQLTEDETKLIFEQEIYAEGRIVKRKEEFPVATMGESLPKSTS
jgi:hypothetical protein